MTDTSTVDPYALSSGLIDDFDGTVSEAYFGTDAAYNNGDTVLLVLELSTDDPDHPQETVKLSTGTGWTIEGQGASIVSESGKARSFNKNSRVGQVIAAALNIGAGDAMRAKGTPMEASTWAGLSFHWNRVELVGFNGETKEALLPTAFLGDEGGTQTTTTAAAAPATGEVDAATRAKLIMLAKSSADHGAFVDAALVMDGIAANAAAVDLIVDEAFFTSAKG